MVKLVTLENGLRVVMERMDAVRSVSLGVWINTGSVRESPSESGASHFIEHMVFKGTKRRSAVQIAAETDSIGGTLNAFTSKECTCVYARVLDEHLPVAVDILSDIVLHSTFVPEELEKEKSVIIEEILMNEDSPEDVTAETANALFFGDDPLSRPILGTKETVSSFTRDSLLRYMKKHYVPKNLVVACAGSFDEDKLLSLVEKAFEMEKSDCQNDPLVQGYSGGSRLSCIKKDIEQVHITLMAPGCARDAKLQYPLAVLSNAIGGSMSSRLFQSIREQRGLAYSVYSYPIYYTDTGSFALYAGTGEKQSEEVFRLMLSELAAIRENGITEEEFTRCKEQLKGSYLLGMESVGSVMNAIGKVALLQNREYDEAKTLESIACVTMDDIDGAIRLALDPKNFVSALVGRSLPHEKQYRDLMQI